MGGPGRDPGPSLGEYRRAVEASAARARDRRRREPRRFDWLLAAGGGLVLAGVAMAVAAALGWL